MIKQLRFLLLFIALTVVMYLPLLHKSFASDDFAVLRRIVYFDNFLAGGFFRPLSDITLYIDYMIGGYRPWIYNLTNFVIHGTTVYFVFLLAQKIKWVAEEQRHLFSWAAAVIFLFYPFHNESVVWTVGRASLTAAFFGMLSLLVALSSMATWLRYLLACSCYFIGMCGYESVFVLPAIVLIFLYEKNKPVKNYLPWVGWMGLTLLVYSFIRVKVAGVFVNGYSEAANSNAAAGLVSRILKTTARLLAPPNNNSSWFIGIAIAVFLITALVIFRLAKKTDAVKGFLLLLLSLLLAMLVPFSFGISTRTYEGDRLFYFPSVFLCILLAYLICCQFNRRQSVILVSGLLIYFAIYMIIDLSNWKKASDITEKIIGTLEREKDATRQTIVINIPQEYNGAHVLRNGFYDALWMHGADTSKIRAVNYLPTEETMNDTLSYKPRHNSDGIFIPPATYLRYGTGELPVRVQQKDRYDIMADSSAKIFYWDRQQLQKLQ